jgi:hypothetical protein
VDVGQGTITAPTSNGSTSVVSSLSFTPKVVIFWTTGQTATGIAASSNAMFSLGAASSSSDQGWCGFCSDHSPTTMNTGKAQRDDSCIGLLTAGTPTLNAYATMTTLAANGFTITWTDAPSSAILIHWLALGGSDITNVKVGKMSVPTSGATFDTTGLGFQPNRAIFFGCRQAAASMNATSVHSLFHIGACDGGEQWAQTMGDPDGVGTSTGVSSFSASECIRAVADGGVTMDVQCSFNSWLSDGFRLNCSNFPAAATNVFYIAFDALGVIAASNTRPTSNITVDYMAADPDAVLFSTITAANNDTTTTNVNTSGVGLASIEVGAMTGAAQGMAGAYTDDAAGTAICCKRFVTSDVMFMGDPATTATTVGTAARSAITDPGKFALSWTGTTATAYRFGYVSFGREATAPTGSLLDDFNRAAIGADYTSPVRNVAAANFSISASTVLVAPGGFGDTYYNPQLYQDAQTAIVDVSAAPNASSFTNILLRITDPGVATCGYAFGNYVQGSGYSIAYKEAAGAETGSFAAYQPGKVLAAGDKLACSIDGSGVVNVYAYDASRTLWFLVCTATTPVPTAMPGGSYLGFMGNNTQGVDNWTVNATIIGGGGAPTVKSLSALGVG